MSRVARVDVDVADSTLITGARTVFVDGNPAAFETSVTAAGSNVIQGAQTVFVEGRPIARAGDITDRGVTITGGSRSVSASDTGQFLSGLTVPSVSYVLEQADADGVTDPVATVGQIQGTINSAVGSGLISTTSSLYTSTGVGSINNKIPPYINTAAYSLNWNSFTQDNIPYNTLMLTERTSLADFTLKAALWGNQPSPPGPNAVYQRGISAGDNKYIRAQYGLTVPQILHNLSNLAKYVYEPIRDRYPNVVVTNTFRQGPPGGANEQRQHGLGMAMDLVFPGVNHSGYYDIAVWIRDNLPFDQLLQEKSGSTIWIHVSHYSGFGTQVQPQNRVANMIVSPSTQFIPGLAVLA